MTETALALPDMFAAKGAKNKVCADLAILGPKNRCNQHNCQPDGAVSKAAMQKRMSGRLQTALSKAKGPNGQKAKDKWAATCALKGQKGMDIWGQKKEFMLHWVSDPEWADLTDNVQPPRRPCLSKAKQL